jgi:hypothetical protein
MSSREPRSLGLPMLSAVRRSAFFCFIQTGQRHQYLETAANESNTIVTWQLGSPNFDPKINHR